MRMRVLVKTRQRTKERVYNGFLIIKKDPGCTSHQVVGELRRLLKQSRIGHTGTLDPMAGGVLVMALGQATKVIPYLDEQRKIYRARLILGVVTDTQDITGRIISSTQETKVSLEALGTVFKEKTGMQEQLPPMFSAVKVNGEPLYKQARRGREVPRKKRPIHIYRLEFLGRTRPVYGYKEGPEFLVECSKGTYVRTLCHDIGQALGCGGCLGELERLASGPFTLSDAWSTAEIAAAVQEETVAKKIIPPLQALAHLPQLALNPETVIRVEQGNAIPAGEDIPMYPGTGAQKIVAGIAGNRLAAILKFTQKNGKEFWQPVRVFARAAADR